MLKKCISCGVEKHLNEFRRDKTKKDGVQPHCKSCARTYHKSVYIEKYSAKVSERNKARHCMARDMLNDYKSNHPCMFCGETELVCLEFHHLDPTAKELSISQGKNGSLERLKQEIKKCIVVCSNCHRKIHAGLISVLPL